MFQKFNFFKVKFFSFPFLSTVFEASRRFSIFLKVKFDFSNGEFFFLLPSLFLKRELKEIDGKFSNIVDFFFNT